MPSIKEALVVEPKRWPWLDRAARDLRRAHSTKIDWIVDRLTRTQKIATRAEFNYTEIFRGNCPANVLDKIEARMQDGLRTLDTSGPHITMTMGSVYELLGRVPIPSDHLALYVLRDLFQTGAGDWIAEVSILARREED